MMGSAVVVDDMVARVEDIASPDFEAVMTIVLSSWPGWVRADVNILALLVSESVVGILSGVSALEVMMSDDVSAADDVVVTVVLNILGG